ncbi:hypothetical protein ASPWEDRAFT_36826 [Aspergillus wentii DTO 134E9]|uniref:DNA replication factor Cdt1 C-terminal domain-containing protein n=1 Tax=Aspergillus wentii DTO 134E9 TaxID=1073089 RepID=A0A1L9RW02_ASPWE|nr:uncharacterized protein ASPWEDRAFT_36826 [Aspergillus wentii DTO 134E9]KAI9929194.1 hypothetical protein MW887_001602 [Aspergillus wentii]OJJ39102.1 hypothetical protein ASPWEDRAFT_36826 [Aspergillus wentii DTO 134E9]
MPRTTRRTPLPRGQGSIQTFARTTKPGITVSSNAKDGIKAPTKTPLLPISPSKKRKLNEIVEQVQSTEKAVGGEVGENQVQKEQEEEEEEAATPSKTLRFSDLSVNSPRSARYAGRSPSKRTQVIHEDSVPVPSTPSKRTAVRKNAPNSKSTPTVTTTSIPRPQSFQDLLNLHLAFSKALTIHFAHNGATTPADLREFLPSIERLWRKRKVVVKDLQRLVWISEQGTQTSGPTFRLANYGLGKICLERVNRDRVDENEMQERFEQTVELLWEKAEESDDGREFIETLGVSLIHESLTPFSSFRKGQQRLQDLKGGIIRMKTEKLKAEKEDDGSTKKPEATTNRRMGLLDRIKNKELRQSKLPPPPSKDMLLRRAAAERVEEVVGIVACLRPVGYVGTGIKAMLAAQRKPFRLETMVQNIQDSMRNPISAQEVEMCLELLARPDVAGQWVNLVAVNEIKSVVLKSSADVSPKEIGAKVDQIKAKWDESAFKLDTSP